MTANMNDTMRLQMAHRSVRQYRDEPIPEDTLKTLIRCGQAAASSSFVQAYSVVRVTRPEARAAIAEAAGGQPWIINAPEFLVFCADLRRIEAVSQQGGEGELEGYTEHGLVAVIDAALVAQNVFLAAESLGLGGVLIGGLRNDPQVTVEQLKLPRLVAPLFGFCLGWPDQDTAVKERLPVDVILHQDEYSDANFESEQAPYDQRIAGYYASRGLNAKTDDWSGSSLRAIQGKKREHMLPFLQQQGFFKK
ncbi:MAG: oxygen-insensitive NADPH nitroreductase [Gammaproteobacteria bacterium]